MRRDMFFWSACLSIVAIVSSWPLLSAHYTVIGVDMTFHLGRIEGIYEGLLSGQFPVRVNPIQLGGYGMPTGIFYPDVFLYIPALLRLLGVPLIDCWTAFLVGINILAAFVGWWAFSTYTRSIQSGAVASLFYTVGFVRLAKLYLTMDVGEALAWAFLPAALVSIWVTVQRRPSYWLAAVVFSTCVFASHILTSILLVFTTLLILAGSIRRLRANEVRWAVTKAIIFIALLNLWMYVPLFYFHDTMSYRMKGILQQEVWYKLIYPLFGFDFYIGSVLLLLVLGLAAFFAMHREKVGKDFWLLLCIGGGLLFLISHPQLWKMLGTSVGFLQAPLRLAVFPMMAASLAAGLGIGTFGLNSGRQKGAILLLAFIMLGSNFLWLGGRPCYPIPTNIREEFDLPFMVRTSKSHIEVWPNNRYDDITDYMEKATYDKIVRTSDDHMSETLFREKLKDVGIHPSDRISKFQRTGNDFRLQMEAGGAQWIQLPLFWYEGYQAVNADGASLMIQRDDDGQVSVWCPSSSGHVHVWYGGLSWFRITDGISFLALLGFCCILYRKKKREDV